ncbi:hypothetical protein PP175_25935 (plasmid) [Aneurinibacillus sp. Ricciae_BoGa-3]|uniref:hypothetical protein n=1 Tax=Aneurinibacillus sp. Ricciae_BoGa-3 TaxID=3022697 RepID=UPI002340BED6|nr:hypothetical protein [Aneurinibacillus sp. Ricciae_BoGa-3]WCK57510.1 hypothetical protein PP175_25935 [Aneurinibacillus sp. Ricciae_BoGa-3]
MKKFTTKMAGVAFLLTSLSFTSVQADVTQATQQVNQPETGIGGFIHHLLGGILDTHEDTPSIQAKPTPTPSLSNWGMDSNNLHLYFKGEDKIPTNYQTSHNIDTEYGRMTLDSQRQGNQNEVINTLKDANGKVVYTEPTKVTDSKSFQADIPFDHITHSASSGFELKIKDCNDKQTPPVVISTANTVPSFTVYGIGVATIGAGFILAKRRKKGGVC